MNADNVLNVLIEFGIVGEDDVRAADALLKESADRFNNELSVTVVTQEAVKNAIQKTGNDVKGASQKWAEHREEVRQAGNEPGRAATLGNAGDIMFSENAATAFGAAKAVEFFKNTWTDIRAAIKGPINTGLPDTAPAHISAAAEAWQAYAEARAKVIASTTGPEVDGNAEEKRLTKELGIDTANNYRTRQATAADKTKGLLEAAGAESGKAAILRKEIGTDAAAETAQNAVNGRVAQLHQNASPHVQNASNETVAAVQAFMTATLGSYDVLRTIISQNQRELEALRRQTNSNHTNNR